MESLIVKIYSIIQGAAAAPTTSRNESIREAESWANLNRQTLCIGSSGNITVGRSGDWGKDRFAALTLIFIP